MIIADSNIYFTFVVVEWKGTLHNARILDYAFTILNMNFLHSPLNKCYLVDVGYSTPMECTLVPSCTTERNFAV
ncbi:hypothetical protein CR513_36129, partial [Mucuna pruriens]